MPPEPGLGDAGARGTVCKPLPPQLLLGQPPPNAPPPPPPRRRQPRPAPGSGTPPAGGAGCGSGPLGRGRAVRRGQGRLCMAEMAACREDGRHRHRMRAPEEPPPPCTCQSGRRPREPHPVLAVGPPEAKRTEGAQRAAECCAALRLVINKCHGNKPNKYHGNKLQHRTHVYAVHGGRSVP